MSFFYPYLILFPQFCFCLDSNFLYIFFAAKHQPEHSQKRSNNTANSVEQGQRKNINQKSQKRKVNPKTSVSFLCIHSLIHAHKHRAHSTLPSVIPVLFTRSRATTCDLTRHHGHGSWQIREAFNLHNTDSCSTRRLGLSLVVDREVEFQVLEREREREIG